MTNGDGRSIRHSVTLNRDLLYYAVRQDTSAGSPIVLRFALPRETVDEVLSSFRRRLWIASFFILLIAGGISLLFSRSFTDRVERLKDFSRRVAEGDFLPLPRMVQAMLWRPSAFLSTAPPLVWTAPFTP